MNRKIFLMIVLTALICALLTGCASPGAKATYKDYTGNIPNGSLGTVMHVAEHPDHKGVKVTLVITGFGELKAVTQSSDAKKVAEELVTYASLKNDAADFSGSQYYYIYYSDSFREKSYLKVDLFYLVPPEAANENLRFVFDYPVKKILLDEPVNLY